MNKIFKIILIIVGLVTAIFLLVTFWPKTEENKRDTQRKEDLKLIQQGLQKYLETNSAYPNSKTGRIVGCNYSPCIWGKPWISGEITYMEKLVHDPLASQSYLYVYQVDDNSYTLEACLENVNDKSGIKTDYTIWCKSGLVYKVESK